MSAVVLSGREVVHEIQPILTKAVSEENGRQGRPMRLMIVEFGAFDDARLYAQSIRRVMDKVGIELLHHRLDGNMDRLKAHSRLCELIEKDQATGILILTPVPPQLNHRELVLDIPQNRDAEGTHHTADRSRGPQTYPPTALAVLELILATRVPIEGQDAVIVGRSEIVGKPVAMLLLTHHATVTLCHSRTRDLEGHVGRADILVAAAGKPEMIKGGWIKKGAVVIDAGENMMGEKPVGDVEFQEAVKRAGFISPVPDGVGPVTAWMLVRNLLTLSKKTPSGVTL